MNIKITISCLLTFIVGMACNKKKEVLPEEETGHCNFLSSVTETRTENRQSGYIYHYRYQYDDQGLLTSLERDQDTLYFSYTDEYKTVTISDSKQQGTSIYYVDAYRNITNSDFIAWDGSHIGSFYYTYDDSQRLLKVENLHEDYSGHTTRRALCEFTYRIDDENATQVSFKNYDFGSWDGLFHFSLGGFALEGSINPIEYLLDKQNNIPDFLPFKAVSRGDTRLPWREKNLLSRFGYSRYEYTFDSLGRMISLTVTSPENSGYGDYIATVKFEFNYRCKVPPH